jgi:hypothetical protein
MKLFYHKIYDTKNNYHYDVIFDIIEKITKNINMDNIINILSYNKLMNYITLLKNFKIYAHDSVMSRKIKINDMKITLWK